MLGIRSDPRGLFEADHLYLDFVGRDSLYGFLASQRGKLFRHEDFAKLYCLENGCPSVPPSLVATALLLQTYDRVSDEEAKARADFDLRWKVALGIELDVRPFAKSTLQLSGQTTCWTSSSVHLCPSVGEAARRGLRAGLVPGLVTCWIIDNGTPSG